MQQRRQDAEHHREQPPHGLQCRCGSGIRVAASRTTAAPTSAEQPATNYIADQLWLAMVPRVSGPMSSPMATPVGPPRWRQRSRSGTGGPRPGAAARASPAEGVGDDEPHHEQPWRPCGHQEPSQRSQHAQPGDPDQRVERPPVGPEARREPDDQPGQATGGHEIPGGRLAQAHLHAARGTQRADRRGSQHGGHQPDHQQPQGRTRSAGIRCSLRSGWPPVWEAPTASRRSRRRGHHVRRDRQPTVSATRRRPPARRGGWPWGCPTA